MALSRRIRKLATFTSGRQEMQASGWFALRDVNMINYNKPARLRLRAARKRAHASRMRNR